MAKQEYMGIQIDTSRDELFDKLGIQRLKESYMTDDEDTPQKRFVLSVPILPVIQNTHRDYTTTPVNTGCPIPHLFCRLVGQRRECLSLVFLTT